jgi:hypothetical protein
MKRIIIAMLLVLAGCQWAAASTDDSTAAREIYNRYASRRGYIAKIKHSQGVSLVWITAKNDAKWQELKGEMTTFETPIPIDTAKTADRVSSKSLSLTRMGVVDTSNLCNLSKLMIPTEVKYDSAVAVTKTVVYENGKLKEEKTEVKTDEQLDSLRSQLIKSSLVKDAAKHAGTSHIMVSNDDERTVCLCFYSSDEDLLSLIFLATALLGK